LTHRPRDHLPPSWRYKYFRPRSHSPLFISHNLPSSPSFLSTLTSTLTTPPTLPSSPYSLKVIPC
jgi:hypothetical protein